MLSDPFFKIPSTNPSTIKHPLQDPCENPYRKKGKPHSENTISGEFSAIFPNFGVGPGGFPGPLGVWAFLILRGNVPSLPRTAGGSFLIKLLCSTPGSGESLQQQATTSLIDRSQRNARGWGSIVTQIEALSVSSKESPPITRLWHWSAVLNLLTSSCGGSNFCMKTCNRMQLQEIISLRNFQ